MNAWGELFGLIPAVWGDFNEIVRKRWWLITLIGVGNAAVFQAMFNAGVRGQTLDMPVETVLWVGLGWIFADVMRVRWPKYRQTSRQIGELVPLAIGVGISLAVVIKVPNLLLTHAGYAALGTAFALVISPFWVTKFAFVLYASQETGEPFKISWKLTEGIGYWTTLLPVFLSLAVTYLSVSLIHFAQWPAAGLGITYIVELLTMAFFSPWKIRWMGSLLVRTAPGGLVDVVEVPA